VSISLFSHARDSYSELSRKVVFFCVTYQYLPIVISGENLHMRNQNSPHGEAVLIPVDPAGIAPASPAWQGQDPTGPLSDTAFRSRRENRSAGARSDDEIVALATLRKSDADPCRTRPRPEGFRSISVSGIVAPRSRSLRLLSPRRASPDAEIERNADAEAVSERSLTTDPHSRAGPS